MATSTVRSPSKSHCPGEVCGKLGNLAASLSEEMWEHPSQGQDVCLRGTGGAQRTSALCWWCRRGVQELWLWQCQDGAQPLLADLPACMHMEGVRANLSARPQSCLLSAEEQLGSGEIRASRSFLTRCSWKGGLGEVAGSEPSGGCWFP